MESNPNTEAVQAATDAFSARFELGKEIARSNRAAIYEAYDRILARTIAVKVFQSDSLSTEAQRERFQNEARKSASLHHQNIVEVFTFGWKDKNTPYIGMELVKGVTLEQLIERQGKLDPEPLRKIFEQVLDALNYAHSQNLIHRDIRPANIMLCENSANAIEVKLLDFGLSKELTSGNSLAATQTTFSEQDYMSPEQRAGLACDARSEVYSVAASMQEAFLGRKTLPDSRSGLSNSPDQNALQQLIKQAMETDPSLRPQSIEDFARRLQATQSAATLQRSSQLKSILFKSLIACIALGALIIAMSLIKHSSEESRNNYVKSMNAKRTTPRAALIAGEKLKTEKKFDQAIAVMNSVLNDYKNRLDPFTLCDLHEKISQCYFFKNDRENQIRHLKLALETGGVNGIERPTLSSALADAYIHTGRKSEAKAHQLQMIRKAEAYYRDRPNIRLADYWACYAYFYPENPIESEEYAMKALTAYKALGAAYYNEFTTHAVFALYNASKKLQRTPAALAEIQSLKENLLEQAKTDPGKAEPVFRFAQAADRVGMQKDALEMYQVAVKLFEQDPQIHNIFSVEFCKDEIKRLKDKRK